MNYIKSIPTNDASKKEQVKQIFNAIAPKYDFLNHLLSFGIDRTWRKKAIMQLKENNSYNILDVATGTADMAILAAKTLNDCKIIGIDISDDMIYIGKNKIAKARVDTKVQLQIADSENLPFQDASFEAVMSAFGVRNFENLEKGLTEIYRVLKPNGKMIILEFSKPQNIVFKYLYTFYFKWILPRIGKLISKNKFAYHYLPTSVNAFPYGQQFIDIISNIGFTNCKTISLTFGIATIYIGYKN